MQSVCYAVVKNSSSTGTLEFFLKNPYQTNKKTRTPKAIERIETDIISSAMNKIVMTKKMKSNIIFQTLNTRDNLCLAYPNQVVFLRTWL